MHSATEADESCHIPARGERNLAIARAAQVLQGLIPYDNPRRMSVTAPYDGHTLGQFLSRRHPHLPATLWQHAMERGDLAVNDRPGTAEMVVRAGAVVLHIERDVVEPEINAAMHVLHEDHHILVVNKPAPLPVHPGGRFNRHTALSLLQRACPDLSLSPAHRLDAATTGVLVFAKHRAAARHLAKQFKMRQIKKHYLTRVVGHPGWERTTCERPISTSKHASGGRRVDRSGATAQSHFERLQCDEDGTSLLRAEPESGRTNQLRVHLASLGHPIVGDQHYAEHVSAEPVSYSPPLVGQHELLLHAWQLQLRHPHRETALEIQAPAPDWVRWQSS